MARKKKIDPKMAPVSKKDRTASSFFCQLISTFS
jgi:hypothetical protein